MLALGSLPFLNVLATRFSRRLHPAVMGIQQESAELAAVVEETVAGVRVVKGFGAEPVQAARLRTRPTTVYGRSMEAARVRATFLPALELLPNIGLIAMLGYGGHQVLNGNLTLGQLVGFNVYVVMLIWPLRMLGMIIAQGQRSAAAAERVRRDPRDRARDRRLARRQPAAGGGPDGGRGEVRFEGVRFALRRPSCRSCSTASTSTVPAGQSVALVGATGIGQDHRRPAHPALLRRRGRRGRASTASTCATCGVRDAAQGRRHRVRGHVPVLRQHRRQHRLRRPRRPARGASRGPPAWPAPTSSSTALPEGYDTPIGERGFSLSGGQRQRIAIARAILADPRVLILDDATSSVDPTKEHEIRDALTEVMRGRTTIVIAHRPATIALADRVVLLERRPRRRRGHPRRRSLDSQRALPRGARGGRAATSTSRGSD